MSAPLTSRPRQGCRLEAVWCAASVETYEPARVNDEPTMRSLIEMGVTAIETDDPKLLLRMKRELGVR